MGRFYDFENDLFDEYLTENFLPDETPEKLKQKGKQPNVFLKLDSIFNEGPKDFPDYCPVYEYAEGLWMKNEGNGTPGSGNDSTPATWVQSRFLIKIPNGNYHPRLRNFAAKRSSIKDCKLIETTRLKDEKLEVILTYSLPNCWIEAVLNDQTKKLKLVLRCNIVRLETKKIDKTTHDKCGSVVSEIDIPEHTIK